MTNYELRVEDARHSPHASSLQRSNNQTRFCQCLANCKLLRVRSGIYTIGGLAVCVESKPVRYLRLSLRPPEGAVRVSAPHGTAREDVEAFVRAHLGWIARKQREIAARPRPAPRLWADGETLRVHGTDYLLRLVPANRFSLTLDGAEAVFACPAAATPFHRGARLALWMRRLLERDLARLVPEAEELAGERCGDWRIRDMETRWGTCAVRKRRIWLALALATVPEDCIRYVCVHELCHFRHRKHDAAFHAAVARALPGWKALDGRLDRFPLRRVGPPPLRRGAPGGE